LGCAVDKAGFTASIRIGLHVNRALSSALNVSLLLFPYCFRQRGPKNKEQRSGMWIFILWFTCSTFRFICFEDYRLITSTKEAVFSCVCLTVYRITHKLLNTTLWNFMEWLDVIQGPT